MTFPNPYEVAVQLREGADIFHQQFHAELEELQQWESGIQVIIDNMSPGTFRDQLLDIKNQIVERIEFKLAQIESLEEHMSQLDNLIMALGE